MSLPQIILSGALCFGTRRIKERRFLLKPIAEVTALVWYAFAYAVQLHGVVPHALVAMSNHLHWLVTDRWGNLPAFKRDFHRLVAIAIKKRFEVEEAVFSDENAEHVRVIGERGAVEKALYTVLNPVRAGLVERAAEWPGAIWRPGMREVTVKKPAGYFEAPWFPEELTLRFEPPREWGGGEDAWHAEIARMAAEEETKLRRERMREGRGVLGAQRVKQQHHRDRPRTPEGSGPKRKPVLATGGDGELMRRAVAELKAWRRAYRVALERWKVDKTTCFPRGSYWVVVHHGAAVAA